MMVESMLAAFGRKHALAQHRQADGNARLGNQGQAEVAADLR